MELVYLWVEDYKNIKKQGFNFSPRFNCHYDEEKNELTIDENDDYIKNFFGENINVTAIVGKNGSGKSNILEALICIIQKNYMVPWENYKICAVFYNGEIFYTKDINCRIEIQNKKPILSKSLGLFFLHYDYTLNYISNKENNINFNKLYYRLDNYDIPILLQPNKANRRIDNWLMDYLANKDILNFLTHNKLPIDYVEGFFIPYICKLNFSFSNIYHTKGSSTYYKLVREYSEEDIKFMTDISQLKRDDLIYLTKLYIIRKSREKSFDSVIDQGLNYLLKTTVSDNTERLINYLDNKKFEHLYNVEKPHKVKKLKDSFIFIDYLKRQKDTYSLMHELRLDKHEEVLVNLPPWIDIDFLDINGISFHSLSYGQKFLIKFFYSILNQLNTLKTYEEYKNIILCLDEVELGLHPQWQKEYISILVKLLKRYTNRYHFTIICSSHSPFLLSDLPKQNILFLENGKKVEVLKKKQTFGANIHTLLSDSFFMEDGLMGEFAKQKINKIVRYLNGQNKFIDFPIEDIIKVINRIGEPFLKEKLLSMYDEKYPKSKQEKIAELEAEIQRLKTNG